MSDRVVSSGNSQVGYEVPNSGFIEILSGGSATAITVDGGGGIFVRSGGSAFSITLEGPSPQEYRVLLGVDSGGFVSGVVINNSAVGDMSGMAQGVTVDLGSTENTYGTETGTVVNSGGKLNVLGTASGAVVRHGGIIFVSSGSVASGAVVSALGTLEVLGGGTITGTVLNIEGKIDLTTLPFVSGATATLNSATDVLTVNEGGHTTTLQLAGDYKGMAFGLESDGASGILIGDGPANPTPTYSVSTVADLNSAIYAIDLQVILVSIRSTSPAASRWARPNYWRSTLPPASLSTSSATKTRSMAAALSAGYSSTQAASLFRT